MEFLRDIAHLRPRTNTFGAVLRIRHNMAFAIHKYFNDVDWNSDLDTEYFKRWYVYKKIEDALCIDDVLWDVDSGDFFKFEFGKRLTVSNMTTIKVAAVKALSKEIEKLKGLINNEIDDS